MLKKIVFSPASIDATDFGVLSDPHTPGLQIVPLSGGKKRWRFRRRIAKSKVLVTMTGGSFPRMSIAEAREWVGPLNELVETGIDPREVLRAEKCRTSMTVAKAHELLSIGTGY
jgi:Arm DNA-binding domain